MNILNQKSRFLFAIFAVITAVVLSTLLIGTIANAQEEITPSNETSTSPEPLPESSPSSETSPPCCETATSTAPSSDTSTSTPPLLESLPNNPPTLSFPTTGPYAGDGIDPNSGDTTTEFTFRIIYTDADNNPPSFINTFLFGHATTTIPMSVDTTAESALHDGNHTNGEQYVATGKREVVGTHYYTFEASDGNNVVRFPQLPDVAGLPLEITILPPVISPPSEERLIFSTNRDGNWELYSMVTDGAGQANLTNNAAFDIDPGTHVNGSKIVFSSNRSTALNHLYIMDRDGGNVTPVFPGFVGPVSYREPNFFPDGTKIIATRAASSPPPGGLGPTEIVIMNTDGTNIINLSNNPANDSRPVFTPDGSRIVFSSDRGNSSGMYDIYIMNADGTQQTRLTFSVADDDLPDVSPDGNKIAFATNRNGNYEIYTMKIDGSGLTRITNNPADEVYSKFSPDGSKIAFVSNRDGNFEVYIMNADGSNQTRLTHTPADEFQPTFLGGTINPPQAPPNNPPILSFPTIGPYAGDGIDPNTGTANATPFFFKVIYTDTDNDPPSNIALAVDNETVPWHVMTVDTEALDTLHDGSYANGEQYTFTSQFPRGDHHYHFEASDGTNAVRIPASDLSFRSGLVVAVKSSANIRSDRGTSASIIGVAQWGEILELLPLCSEIGDTSCNDTALLYTLKDGHYWLKIKWNNSTGFIAEDLVMTVVPGNQPERVKEFMTEVFAQPDFTTIQSFPIELLLAIAAHESGGTLNNEITSVDSPFSGIMQVHPSTSGRNTNCTDNICQKIGNYWTNIKNPFTDIFDISTNNKDGKVFMLKNYVSTSYNNTDDGLRNNIFDGLKVLTDKYRARCPKESIFFTDSLSGIIYELTCGDMEKIRATWAYNGLIVDKIHNYLQDISNQLANLSSVFPSTFYANSDQLIEKLRLANDNKIEVKKYSPVDLRVQNSFGATVGEFNGEMKDEIYNAIYDPSTESIGIFFPQDTYRYIVVGNATSTYGLTINSTSNTTTTFTATDIPVIPGAVHEYTIDEVMLERGEMEVTIRIDENGDGVFEKTIVSDGELTHEEYILQTKTVIDFDPDTLNIKSGSSMATVYIELPDSFDIGTIDVTTVKLNDVSALEKPTSISDYNNNGIPDLMAKFDRSTIIKTLPQEGDSATVTIMGKVIHNGNYLSFKGVDTVKIVGRK